MRCIMSRFAVAAALVLVCAGWSSGQDKFLDKITKAIPEKAAAKPQQPRKLLIFSRTKGFRHSSIPVGIKAIEIMGDKTGAYTALATEDESYFEPDKLKSF